MRRQQKRKKQGSGSRTKGSTPVLAVILGLIVLAVLAGVFLISRPKPPPEPIPGLQPFTAVPRIETVQNEEELVNKAHAELYRLINAHPDSFVRGGMTFLIRNEILRLNFQAADKFAEPIKGVGTLAAVFVARKNGQYFEYVDKSASADTLVAIMNINPSRLLDKRDSECFKQGVITHEYTHLVQLFSGRWREELFFFYQTGTVPLDSAFVHDLFEVECQAHHSQSVFMAAYGNPQELDLGAAFASGGYLAMRQELARVFIESHNMRPYQDMIRRLASYPPGGADKPPDLQFRISYTKQ